MLSGILLRQVLHPECLDGDAVSIRRKFQARPAEPESFEARKPDTLL